MSKTQNNIGISTLLTPKLQERFRQVRTQNKTNPMVITRFLDPSKNQIWNAIEYDSKERLFIGSVSFFQNYSHYTEWVFFSLDALENSLGIYRDLDFSEKSISECNKEDAVYLRLMHKRDR